MKVNTRTKGKLNNALFRVPFEHGKPKYLPLDNLPTGTEVTFFTKTAIKPNPVVDDDIFEINGAPEELVYYMPEGEYKLRTLDWGTVSLSSEVFEGRVMKPLYNLLSITSTFTANFDENRTTFRLQTGLITQIRVGPYCMKIDDIKKQRLHTQNRKNKVRGSYKLTRNRRFN